jgi:flagellar protein FliL
MADAKAAALDTEADLEEDAEGAGEQPKSKFALKLPPLKFLIIGGLALALVGGGVGAYFVFFTHKEEAKVDPHAAKPAVFVDLPEVLVNLANGNSDRTQYLKIKVVLELPDQKMIEQITPIMPRVMDAFQTYLRELRPSDLDGSAGLYRLKEELTRRVNASIAPSRINAVLFKEIVVQ